MITLRKGKTKNILESSMSSAITAVETYNRPMAKFRTENYIMLMIVAWTKLFHAYFQATIGERYFYKDKNGRYKRIDGERKAWELSECIKHYNSNNPPYYITDAMRYNLTFFINIRNKIEHRYWSSSSLDITLFGECQALLYNYEGMLIKLFGNDYSINTCLAYSLQFSQMRSPEQLKAQREQLSRDMQDLKKYIDKYKTDLPQEIYDSQEYSIKLLQIPKVSNTNRGNLAVEFVNWNSLNDEDRDSYQRITTIIKDKIVKQPVVNADLQKPSGVIKALQDRTGNQISISNHTDLWKAFSIRPVGSSDDKFDTNTKYCLYDEPHDDYLYTDEWIEFLTNLITSHGFSKDNIRDRCKEKLKIEDYI